MKNLLGVLFVLTLGFSSQMAMAQSSVPNAIINENGIIQIPTDIEIKSSYFIDLSGFNFENEEAMTAFLKERECELFVFRANPSQNKGILMLQKKRHPEWSAEQWNAVLAEKLAANPLIQ